jgi:hypothetical protein
MSRPAPAPGTPLADLHDMQAQSRRRDTRRTMIGAVVGNAVLIGGLVLLVTGHLDGFPSIVDARICAWRNQAWAFVLSPVLGGVYDESVRDACMREHGWVRETPGRGDGVWYPGGSWRRASKPPAAAAEPPAPE